jgi:hypothetical protein
MMNGWMMDDRFRRIDDEWKMDGRWMEDGWKMDDEWMMDESTIAVLSSLWLH